MTNQNPDPNQLPESPIDVEDLRPHVYDGIQEYDKRLPNWWLFTLYGSIVFAIGYWTIAHTMGFAPDPGAQVTEQIRVAKSAAVKNSPELSDAKLYALSHDPAAISAGKATFDTLCVSCHKPDLTGLIGPNLKDQQWVHGGKPMDSIKTITEGIVAKGMPTWGPILGSQKIGEVTAYIFSFHQEGEPVEIKPWVPVGAPGVPAPAAAAPADPSTTPPAPAAPAAPTAPSGPGQ